MASRPSAPRTGAERYFAGLQEDEEYALAYKQARYEIDEIDRIMRQVEQRRQDLGWSKARLARSAGLKPEAVRRLLTAQVVNPTLRTILALANAVDMRLDLQLQRGATRSPNRQVHC